MNFNKFIVENGYLFRLYIKENVYLFQDRICTRLKYKNIQFYLSTHLLFPWTMFLTTHFLLKILILSRSNIVITFDKYMSLTNSVDKSEEENLKTLKRGNRNTPIDRTGIEKLICLQCKEFLSFCNRNRKNTRVGTVG